MADFYSIKSETVHELVIKKSRFIAWAVPVSSAEKAGEFLDRARKLWPGAAHYCYAYILREPYGEKYSDDGEPAGTAGLPILNVIKSYNYTNVLVMVVRYFGGILLGASGLVRAYATAASHVLERAEKQPFIRGQRLKVETDYVYWGKIEYLCRLENVLTERVVFDTAVRADFLVPLASVERFKKSIITISRGTAVISTGECKYYPGDEEAPL
ncbi:uncharacterized protein, YigZ family [Thermosyntropha lipolytica DSM 11003]|uniref:Uncharacterized protein, YigZ family n=1 Tax=Thermosyntropha lipolytica DSM 11003 TaxID=1123382 RepID=A0A1M5KSP7_9FIRM|nr:YigZ family protein [Thermosyntropha lipolytica]SHG55814.1 uncharacterized protein, YigZ family [Thermosyntropha lipolytica DSM 11003]